MQSRGAIGSIIRERRPLAVLAMLALMLPSLFALAGLHLPAGTTRLADGTVIICTDEGFQRVAADDPAASGQDLPCCMVCAHHAAAALLADGPVAAAARLDSRRDERRPDDQSELAGIRHGHVGIRAPPAQPV